MSTGTIFDLVGAGNSKDMITNAYEFESKQRGDLPRQNAPASQEMYQPPHDANKMSNYPLIKALGDYGKTVLKGTAKGLQKFGHMINPSGEALFDKEAIPRAEQELAQQLDQLLPTQRTDPVSNLSERFLEHAPSILSFPGASWGLLARTAGSSAAEQLAEEFGAGEKGQTIAGLTAFLGPDLTKKILTTKGNKRLLEEGRRLGLSDKQLAPLLNSDTKKKWLSKLAVKGERSKKSLDLTKESLNEAYSNITKSESAKEALPETIQKDFINKVQKTLFNLPSIVREGIKEDLQDLTSKPISIDSVTNFWKDINAVASSDPEKYRSLSVLKSDISNLLKKVNPQAAKDFNSINELWGKYADIRRKMTPTLGDHLLSAGEVIAPMFAVMTGNFGWLTKLGTEAGIRRLAREMLINPRFQNLSQKMMSALNQNKFGAIEKISSQMAKEVSKYDPKLATEIENIDWDEWKKATEE